MITFCNEWINRKRTFIYSIWMRCSGSRWIVFCLEMLLVTAICYMSASVLISIRLPYIHQFLSQIWLWILDLLRKSFRILIWWENFSKPFLTFCLLFLLRTEGNLPPQKCRRKFVDHLLNLIFHCSSWYFVPFQMTFYTCTTFTILKFGLP